MLRRWGLGVACCLWLACGIPAAAGADSLPEAVAAARVAGASEPDRAEVRERWKTRAEERERRARKRLRQQRELQFRVLGLARGGLAVAGVGLYAWGLWQRRRGGRSRLGGVRQVALAGIAVCAFPAYYNFFQAEHPGGFKSADVFHYYVGSRYFAELGYFDLYPCTLQALVEDGLQDPGDLPRVRDQRTLRLETPDATREAMAGCAERFSPERWVSFRTDVRFFRPRILGGSWTHLLEDHGYNPSPVWSFAGGLVSRSVAPTPETMESVIAIDRVLVVAMGLLVAWAFGLEAACLAAIVWGTSPLWSYNWTGDAFLRNLWLFTTVGGLCLLERGRPFAAGFALAGAGLLRLFPAIFAVGPLLQLAARFRHEGLSQGGKRLVAGLALGGVVLLAAGAFATGRGPAVYLEFSEKMSAVVGQAGINKVGVSALATELVYRATTLELTTPEGRRVKLPQPAPLQVVALRGVQLLLVLVGLVAYLRALTRASPSEAAILGFAVIPLLTSPANYYYVFAICGALLSASRPWVGAALGAALLAWIGSDQLWFLSDARYLAWDAVAIAFSLTVLVGMALSAPAGSSQPAPAGPTTA